MINFYFGGLAYRNHSRLNSSRVFESSKNEQGKEVKQLECRLRHLRDEAILPKHSGSFLIEFLDTLRILRPSRFTIDSGISSILLLLSDSSSSSLRLVIARGRAVS